MPRIINSASFNDRFIGTVKSSNPKTHEIEAFIPKLMQGIASDTRDSKVRTNLGNTSITADFNDSILVSSTMTIMPRDMDAELPESGSLVEIIFLDGDINYGYWRKFNPNGSYSVIEEDRYPEYFKMSVGEKSICVCKDDTINLNLTEVVDVTTPIDPDNKKNKLVNIKLKSYAEDIERIDKTIGHDEYIQSVPNSQTGEKVDATGMFKLIREIDTELDLHSDDIDMLKEVVGHDEYIETDSASQTEETVDATGIFKLVKDLHSTPIYSELPEVDESFRGHIILVENGTSDDVYICKKTNGTLEWRKIL